MVSFFGAMIIWNRNWLRIVMMMMLMMMVVLVIFFAERKRS